MSYTLSVYDKELPCPTLNIWQGDSESWLTCSICAAQEIQIPENVIGISPKLKAQDGWQREVVNRHPFDWCAIFSTKFCRANWGTTSCWGKDDLECSTSFGHEHRTFSIKSENEKSHNLTNRGGGGPEVFDEYEQWNGLWWWWCFMGLNNEKFYLLYCNQFCWGAYSYDVPKQGTESNTDVGWDVYHQNTAHMIKLMIM